MPKFSVMLARFPGGRIECPESVDWIVETVLKIKKNPDISDLVPFRSGDTPADMNRNKAVRAAVAAKCDYLLMIDNDMEPDPKERDRSIREGALPFWDVAWDHMMNNLAWPCAIAAPYCGPSPWNNMYVFRWRTKNNKHRPTDIPSWSLDQFTREEAAERGGIEEVAALPTGLILYDMRVFKDMLRPYFYYEWKDDWHDEKASTEDVTQTRDMSLAWYASGGKIGGRVFCAWDSWAIHNKNERVMPPVKVGADSIGASLKHAVEHGGVNNEKVHVFGGDRLAEFKARQKFEQENPSVIDQLHAKPANGVPMVIEEEE
jgi:hypothetical protein